MTSNEKEKILGTLRFLEMLVVSIDRIGSYSAESGLDASKIISNFIDDYDVFKRAAQLRSELGDFFSDEIPEGEDASELEILMRDVKVWSPPADR